MQADHRIPAEVRGFQRCLRRPARSVSAAERAGSAPAQRCAAFPAAQDLILHPEQSYGPQALPAGCRCPPGHQRVLYLQAVPQLHQFHLYGISQHLPGGACEKSVEERIQGEGDRP